MKKTIRSYCRTLAKGGPVGLIYAMRIAYLESREARLLTLMERERELHRSNMATLKLEFTLALDKRQAVTGSAARFWRAIRGQS